MFDVVLHYPQDTSTKTLRNVVSVEMDWGDINHVHVEYPDGSAETHTGLGLTIAAASEPDDEDDT